MKKLYWLLLGTSILLAVAGCGNNHDPNGPNGTLGRIANPINTLTITVDSAFLQIYVETPSNQTINVHRITASWTESGVTWNTFNEAFAQEVIGTFQANAGWQSVNIATLVQQWMTGATSNFGILLEQEDSTFTRYFSSDDTSITMRPMLKIFVRVNGMDQIFTIRRGSFGEVQDAFISMVNPDANFGNSEFLFTGMVEHGERQSLIRFELPQLSDNSAIGDFVWDDLNCNGIQDMGEPGLPNIEVKLYTCGETLLTATHTDAQGHYLFGNLLRGDYIVKFVLPDSLHFSPRDQGVNDSIDSDANPTTGMTQCINLDSGVVDLTWDAGICRAETVQTGCLGNFVWNDRDADGIQDSCEHGIPFVTVKLFMCDDNSFVRETHTNWRGKYYFRDLTPGDYFIQFFLPDDFVFSPKDQGTNDSLDSDADALTGRTVCITVEGGFCDKTWDAGMHRIEQGCTRSKGFWKNHTGIHENQPDLVTPLLPLWLGLPDSAKSIHVTTGQIAHDILQEHTYGHPSNGITKLYAELLTAKLNIAHGASDADIIETIGVADAFLANHDWHDWDGLGHDLRHDIQQWTSRLSRFNEGEIGPGACDDEGDGDDHHHHHHHHHHHGDDGCDDDD